MVVFTVITVKYSFFCHELFVPKTLCFRDLLMLSASVRNALPYSAISSAAKFDVIIKMASLQSTV